MKDNNRGPSPTPVKGASDWHKNASNNRTKSMPPGNPAPKEIKPSGTYKGSPGK